MKYIKWLVLAAMAMGPLAAAIGVESASATVYCTRKETPCNVAFKNDSPMVISLKAGTSSALETSGGTLLDTCTGSSAKIANTTSGGATSTVGSDLEELTWSGCSKTTDTLAQGVLEVHYISGTDNGTVTLRGTEVTVNTIFGSCVFGAGATYRDIGTFVGGTSPSLEINTSISRISGPCPETAIWTATYVITSPLPQYVEPE